MATQMFKIKKIKEAIKDNNINELRKLAIKHGFINNKLGKQAWPMLLGIKKRQKTNTRNRAKSLTNSNTPNTKQKLTKQRSLSFSVASNKPNYDQIEKDIARSALNFYNLSEEKKEQSRTYLGRILHSMFDESEQVKSILLKYKLNSCSKMCYINRCIISKDLMMSYQYFTQYAVII